MNKNHHYAGIFLIMGFVALIVGAWLIWMPLGLLVAGAILILMAYGYHLAAKEEKK